MTVEQIISKVDHTLLSQTATNDEIKILCGEAAEYGTASVCVPPVYVKLAASELKDRVPVCTVIGFPNGYSETAVKVYETEKAVENGADEIDMVINIAMVKNGDFAYIKKEIDEIRKASEGKILKVIIETCLLTEEEKIEMCRVVGESGSDYIKTSTGFSTGGATFSDVELFKRNIPSSLKIKASGGISTLKDAIRFIELGAERIGTSKIIDLTKKYKL